MTMTSWSSPAKLNLFLYITGQRANGYHDLQTLFHFVDYGDKLHIEVDASGEVTISPEIAGVPVEQNLIYRAARALQAATGCSLGAHITLEKVLPMGGGLGGGSSNAATALVALNLLWNTQLSEDQLAQLGLALGADVPVFIRGKTAYAEGVGEQLTPVEVAEKWYLVVKPNVHIATAAIFSHPNLTRDSKKRSLNTLLSSESINDCEKLVRECFPEVDKALLWLLQYAPSKLTGTGACVFAEFADEASARSVFTNLPDDLTGFVARGINQSPLLTERQAYQTRQNN